MKKKIIIIVCVVIIFGLIAAKLIENKFSINEMNQTRIEVITSVTIGGVLSKVQDATLSISGVTIANQEVTLKSETSGQIASINFNLGDYVHKGKSLVRIDEKLASIALESAKLNLKRLEDEYIKTNNLYKGDAASESKLRDAKLDYEKGKLAVEQAEKQLSFNNIVATQNGFIVSKFVEEGAFVTPGTPIVSIVDISQLKVSLKASEKDAYKLKVGQNVKITSSVYPGIEYNGKVSFVSSQGDALHNYGVEIILNNKQSHQLKAGTFVNAEFQFNSTKPSLLISREALIGSVKDAKVYTVKDNKAILKNIIVGQDFGNHLEVLSGLVEGEKIVTTGQINLYDGSPVSVLNK